MNMIYGCKLVKKTTSIIMPRIETPAIINHKLKIGRVFAAYRDNLVIIDGELKKEHEYLIPKSKVDHYGDKEVYLNITESSLKEFEI